MLGLSASVYTAIYVAFLDPHSLTFLLLLGILPSLLALVCALFINKVPFIQTEPHTKVNSPLMQVIDLMQAMHDKFHEPLGTSTTWQLDFLHMLS